MARLGRATPIPTYAPDRRRREWGTLDVGNIALWIETAAGELTNHHHLTVNQPAAANDGSVDWGSTDNTVRWILLKPGVSGTTSPNQTANPDGIAAQGFGYSIRRSEMNRIGAKRIIDQGISDPNPFINAASGVADAVNSVYRLCFNLYRLNADGTYTFLASTFSGAATTVTGLNQLWNGSPKMDMAQTLFDTDATLHLEIWMRGQARPVTGQTMTISVGQPIGSASGSGIGVDYIRTQYQMAQTAVASLSVAMDRTAIFSRSFATSLTLTAVLGVRTVNLFRTTSLSLSAAVKKLVTPTAKTATLSLTASVLKLVILGAKTATLSLATAIQKKVNVFKTTALSLTATASRLITAARSFTTSLTLATAIQRQTNKFLTTSLSLSASASRLISAFRSFTTGLSLSTAIQKRVNVFRTTSLSLSATMTYFLGAARQFTTALSLTASFTRQLIARRSFSTSLSLATKMFVTISQEILNRLTGGATIIKRFFQVTDDF